MEVFKGLMSKGHNNRYCINTGVSLKSSHEMNSASYLFLARFHLVEVAR